MRIYRTIRRLEETSRLVKIRKLFYDRHSLFLTHVVMYLVKELDKTLQTFEGEDIKGMDGKELSLKKVLVTQLGSHRGTQQQPVAGDQLIKAYELGVKINSAATEVELDDDQAKFVKEVLSANPMFAAVVMGNILKQLEDAKVVAKPAEKAVPEGK